MDKHNMSDYSDRPMSIESQTTSMSSTMTNIRTSRRQYLSLKKHRSINGNTIYSSVSPVRDRKIKIERSSLSPDRKSMYWQNWLLPQGIRKQITFNKPLISAHSACAIFTDNNEILFSQNCHQPRQIASLTKIMTAFTVINICNTYGLKLRDVPIVIHKEAAMMEGTSANLRSGDELAAIDLLYGLLLPSGNDAGIALAQYFGKFLSYTFTHENEQAMKEGDEWMQKFKNETQFYDTQYQNESIKLFVFEMNKNCHKMGLKRTQFTNPTGLTDSKNYSTAYEMGLLTSFCMRNHLLRTIFKKKVYICEARNEKLATIRQIEWKNTNHHLFKLKDCIGVKTGITPGAGPCLSSAYRVMGRKLVVVLLKAKSMDDRFSDAEKVYRYARTKTHNGSTTHVS